MSSAIFAARCRMWLTGYLHPVRPWYLNRPVRLVRGFRPLSKHLAGVVCGQLSAVADYYCTFGRVWMSLVHWEKRVIREVTAEGNESVVRLRRRNSLRFGLTCLSTRTTYQESPVQQPVQAQREQNLSVLGRPLLSMSKRPSRFQQPAVGISYLSKY